MKNNKCPKDWRFQPLIPLILIGFAVIVLLLSFIFEPKSSKAIVYKDFAQAKKDFEKCCTTNPNWFVQQPALPSVRLAVDIDSSRLLIIDGEKCQKIAYTSLSNDVKKVEKDTFSTVLAKYFPTLKLNDTLKVAQIAQMLGVDTSYVSAISAEKKLSPEDITFSLIYNAVAGDLLGHYAVAVEQGKLVCLHEMNFAILKPQQLVEAMTLYQQDDSLASKVVKNAVANDCRFVYLDVRHDKLHFGNESDALNSPRAQNYLALIKAQPDKIFYLCGDELKALQSTDYWGTFDGSKLKAPEENSSDGFAAAMNSPAMRIIVIILLVAAGIWFALLQLRKKSVKATDSTIIEKLTIDLGNITMEKKNKMAEENTPNSKSETSEYNAQRETKINNNQYVYENVSCNSEGIERILDAIDKCTGTQMAQQYRDNQKKVVALQEEKAKLQAELKKKDKELADANVSKNEALNAQKQLHNDLNSYKERLKQETKEKDDANKRAAMADANYKKVSEWMPRLQETYKIMEEAKTKIAALPQLKEADSWNNLRIALLSHYFLVKLLKVWCQDQSLQSKMREKDFTTSIENDAVMLEKLKQFVNAVALKPGLNNSKEIEARVKQLMRENYRGEIPMASMPALDDVINRSIQARVAFEQAKPFMDAMWNNFVKEFASEKNPVAKGKAWYFEHLINIAYHAIDYVMMMEGQNMALCYNYQFLDSKFNPGCPAANAFEYQHVDKSSQISNTIYEWTTEMGIEHLRVLIDKYFIKP